ncbi:Ig-like domain repeat protein [Aeromicrobium endophyticum]|uniref:alpha-amylase n=1 Tax=Aeromicrobium endophyticum TaxID=2292704 RepID=A0A371PBH7_9ACTN|nr:Ig-like domain repeat protein [Aeromicrobium endophyticum]REK73247.1 hypothetical protein DX116_06695 [Aeromicrobium endophyticum]
MSSSPSIVEARRPLAPRLVVALLAALALVLGPLAFVPASAAPGDPATVSGTVALSGDEDLVNIPVTLERRVDRGGDIDWEYENSDYFNGGGYAFADVDPGTYRVKSGGPSADDGSTPYAVKESAPFDVDGTDVTVPALDLTLGGSIGGTTAQDGAGALDGVRVIVSRLELGRYRYEREATSDSDGSYVVTGLRDGEYQLDFSKDDFLHEYYDDIPFDREDSTGATTITILNGNVVTAKDAALTPAAIVSGVVTADGDPLAGVAVSAYRKVVSGGVTSWESSQSYAFTDEDGSYRINTLPAGSYRIGFNDEGTTYAPEFYDDQPSVYSATATTFTVEPGDTEVANADLQLGGSIAGTVTGPDAKIVDVCVEAYGLVDGTYDESRPEPDLGTTDENGDYSLEGLTPGTYKLKFSDCGGNDLVSEYWDDQKTLADAGGVTVTAGETTPGVDATLAPSPTTADIKGVVTDTSDNAELSGIAVEVEQKFSSDDGDTWGFAGSDTTDSNGAYDVEVDDEGTYRVTFTDQSGLHFSEFNGNVTVASGEAAPAIDIDFGDVKTVNAALAPSVAITGTLTRPIGCVEPVAYAVDDADQSDPYFGEANYEAATYLIGELPTGEYKVRFDCGPQSGGAAFSRAAAAAVTAAGPQNWYLGKTSFADANTVVGTAGTATPLQPVTVAPVAQPPVVTPPVVGPPAPSAPAKVKPSIKVSAKAGKKSATLTVTVKASGVSPSGKVTIKLGGKKLKTVTLKRGKATIKLKKLKKGKKAFTIVYSGDSRVLAKTVKSKKISIK